MPESDQTARLLARVPDLPEWIEARAVLREPDCRVEGDEQGFAARSDRLRLGALVGRVEPNLIRRSFGDIPILETAESAGDLWAVVAPGGMTSAAVEALPGWSRSEADIFRESEAGLASPSREGSVARWVEASEERHLDPLPARLSAELGRALERGPLAAAWVDGRPVSFCYPACQSETLWDVSIETLPEFQRRGLAGAAVGLLVERMHARGKRAVWGAHAPNVASRRLAEKLGFERCARLHLLENAPVES